MNTHWLITGASGLLASYLVDACKGLGKVTTTSRSAGDIRCDLSRPDAVRDMISQCAPDVVIHAAGLTDVDHCEREPNEAFATNLDAAVNIASATPASARIVFISTDQVYPDTPGPHRETETGPINVYGRSKLEGEHAILGHPGGSVLRTNFFGSSRISGRDSLSDFFTRKFSRGEEVSLFNDVQFSPLHMESLGALAVDVAEAGLGGVFNAGSRGGTSKAAFALALARHLGLDASHAKITSSTYMPERARRTSDLRLDVSRIESALGREMPNLKEEIGKL